MTRRVLITGATGFVGRQILQHLSKQGVGLSVVVRSEKQFILKDCPGLETILVTQDLFSETPEWWASALSGIDTVVHAAWYAEPGQYLQSSKNIDCLQGTLTMMKGAILAGLRRFVGIGTCFEYDVSRGLLPVYTPLRPLTPYAGSKAAAFIALSQCLPSQAIEFAWCRLFYLYGEGEDTRRLVPYLRSRLALGESAELTSGNQIRDFIDVRDAGRLIADVALSKVQGPINVCSGIPITVKQFAENIADEYGRRDLLKFGARSDNFFDPQMVVGVTGPMPMEKKDN
jgi:dTDP-6-deoxy-L-talose 4-dehydrogenase (NAD+)